MFHVYFTVIIRKTYNQFVVLGLAVTAEVKNT